MDDASVNCCICAQENSEKDLTPIKSLNLSLFICDKCKLVEDPSKDFNQLKQVLAAYYDVDIIVSLK